MLILLYFCHLYFSWGKFGDKGQAVNKTTSIFQAIHVTPKDTANSTLHSSVPSVSGCCCLWLDGRVHVICRARLKRDGTRAELIFGLSEKWTSPFKSAGESVQSNTGSRGVRISGQTVDIPCSEVQCKSSGYPLQSPISPSLPLPRVTVCHHVSNGLYLPASKS